jgi:nicotinate-nucleotide adenylyltransferase
MAKTRRVAVYGGTFDPVHRGHIAIAEGVLSLFSMDEVLFIPAFVAPHKRKANVSPVVHRYAMLALATQNNERLLLSMIEIEAPEKPYTVETLARLEEYYGEETALFFIMGADSWNEIATWREWERLLLEWSHLVVTRPGCELNTFHLPLDIRERIVDLRGLDKDAVSARISGADQGGIFLTDAVYVDVSATMVRQAAAEGRMDEVVRLVPPAVSDYIRKYRLYRDEFGTEFND